MIYIYNIIPLFAILLNNNYKYVRLNMSLAVYNIHFIAIEIQYR